MTKHEAAIIQTYTGYAMLVGNDLSIFRRYCEDLLGFPMWTHEYPEYADKLKELSKRDFVEICKNLED